MTEVSSTNTAEVGNQFGSSQSVAVAGTTVIAQLNVSDFSRVFVEIANTDATNALDGFAILGRVKGSTTFNTLYSAAADFTNPRGLLIGASGDLTTLALGTTGWFMMEVLAIEELKLTASANTGAIVVTVLASGA